MVMSPQNVPQKLLVVDLEATCWSPRQHKPELMETIEIGAVLLELPSLLELKAFTSFVRPVRTPILSPFCKQLTSIQQEDVDSAPLFPEAFAAFLERVGPLDELIFASWGEYDRTQFKRDCTHHDVVYPFGDRHFNIKKYYAKQMQCKARGLANILSSMGMEFEGTPHRGIDDAKNTAQVLRAVLNLHPGTLISCL
jgi:inhibitor of KinA sporulation pathway (predicted exonuclease)